MDPGGMFVDWITRTYSEVIYPFQGDTYKATRVWQFCQPGAGKLPNIGVYGSLLWWGYGSPPVDAPPGPVPITYRLIKPAVSPLPGTSFTGPAEWFTTGIQQPAPPYVIRPSPATKMGVAAVLVGGAVATPATVGLLAGVAAELVGGAVAAPAPGLLAGVAAELVEGSAIAPAPGLLAGVAAGFSEGSAWGDVAMIGVGIAAELVGGAALEDTAAMDVGVGAKIEGEIHPALHLVVREGRGDAAAPQPQTLGLVVGEGRGDAAAPQPQTAAMGVGVTFTGVGG